MLFFLKDNKKEFILWLNVPKVTAYSYGKMFKSTKFAKTAALIGGKEFQMLTE